MKHLQRLLVGIPIMAFATLYFLGGFRSGGGIESAVQLIYVILVCTLGLSGLLWIPFAYAVGALFLGIFSAIFRRQPSMIGATDPDALPGRDASHRREVKAVADFFRQAHAAGRSDEQITALLGEVGWTAEDIRLGRLAAGLEPSQAATT